MNIYQRSVIGEARRAASMPKGNKHWNYKKNLSILGVHKWLIRIYGNSNICEQCRHTKKCDWAKKTGMLHERKRNNYKRLCRSCHIKYDKTNIKTSKRLILLSLAGKIKRNKLGQFIK